VIVAANEGARSGFEGMSRPRWEWLGLTGWTSERSGRKGTGCDRFDD
jgi:hypothetical protein